MCDRVHTDLGSMSASMMEVDKCTENRRGWVTDEVCRSVRRRRHANKEFRKMRGVCGVNDERTESAKAGNFKEKEEKIVSSALHAHNNEVMRKLVKNGKK